jgi:hypothetical protein
MGGLLEQLLSLSILQSLALIILVITVVCVLNVYISGIRYPSNLPRFGEKEGATSFSWRTRKAWYTDCRNMFREAYENVGQNHVF